MTWARGRSTFSGPIGHAGRIANWPLLIAAGLIFVFGLAALYSIDYSRGTTFAPRQAVFAAIGLPLVLVASRISPARWCSIAPWLYVFNLLQLVSVFVIGRKTNEATRWIDIGPLQYQPSEVTKVLVILTLSAFFVRNAEKGMTTGLFVRSLLHVAPFVGLVLLQPHLAGAVSILVVWFAITLAAGMPWRTLLVAVVIAGGLGAAAWYTPGVIKPYMRDRIESKLNPDSQAGAYQQTQAVIAIGVGGVNGTGYLRGERKAARFIPEQQNDFIFTVIGEEGGFVAGSLMLCAFGWFFFRVWDVGHTSAMLYGRCVSNGVLAVLGFHVFVNLGMNLGILPVAGLWLPFVSYGGTALWMAMACVGILLGVE
ncbi:MAG: rod shape-determining protein RodA [Fimbriimonadaceae bacterium]|nr:rod shape-determining protein RodA [Fimbriimonadaceae bacterium]